MPLYVVRRTVLLGFKKYTPPVFFSRRARLELEFHRPASAFAIHPSVGSHRSCRAQQEIGED